MTVQIKESNQRIVIYRGSLILYSALIGDLGRILIFLEGYPLSHHIIQASINPRKELISLYHLGKFIQTKCSESINSIDWPSTYFFVEYEDYIDKLARILMSVKNEEKSDQYFERLEHERLDLWESERHNPEIVNALSEMVKFRLREFGICAPNIR